GPLDDLADAAVRAAMALGRKRGQQFGVAFVTRGSLVESAQVSSRCLFSAWRVEVHPERLKDFRGVPLVRLPLLGRDVTWTDLLPMGCLFGIKRDRGHCKLLELRTE